MKLPSLRKDAAQGKAETNARARGLDVTLILTLAPASGNTCSIGGF